MQASRPFPKQPIDRSTRGCQLTSRYHICRAAELEALTAFRDLIDRACAEHPAVDQQTCYDLKLAVEEACSNVITHGYAGMNPGSLMLALDFEQEQVLVTITDFGHPFEPYEPDAPDVETSLEDGPSHGFGLHFIYQTMDDIGYESAEDGNHLTFVKRLPTSRKK
jgi:anti-sigma regulatory factor (Ser/Thr protein kinase)